MEAEEPGGVGSPKVAYAFFVAGVHRLMSHSNTVTFDQWVLTNDSS